MRFSEFCEKEMIDVENGQRMGVLGQADMLIHPETGEIELIVLSGSSFLGLGRKKEQVTIAWNAIRKVGPDMIIVEMKENGQTRK
jgi:YlmC/YmxH family sporulation protein